MVKKIVILGPESTGKTTLSEQLAVHYDTVWCPEFARQYLLQHGMNYQYNDLLTIAKGQIALEDEYAEKAGKAPFFFIDTDMHVMKVWCEFVFENCHRFILDQIASRKYDLYLLCNVDLAWTSDELREYPDLESREKLYRIYKDIMINQSIPWVDISGDYGERLQRAIRGVDAHGFA